MERKYRTTKKAIVALCVVAVLFIAVIVYLQVILQSAKEVAYAEWEQKYANKQQEIIDLETSYAESGLEEKEDALKDERDDLKKYHKELVKAYEKGEDIQTVIDKYEGTGEEEVVE